MNKILYYRTAIEASKKKMSSKKIFSILYNKEQEPIFTRNKKPISIIFPI